MWRNLEALRDRIMWGTGTQESWYMEEMTRELMQFAIAAHWRKPLRIDEINQLAPTSEVRQRPARP